MLPNLWWGEKTVEYKGRGATDDRRKSGRNRCNNSAEKRQPLSAHGCARFSANHKDTCNRSTCRKNTFEPMMSLAVRPSTKVAPTRAGEKSRKTKVSSRAPKIETHAHSTTGRNRSTRDGIACVDMLLAKPAGLKCVRSKARVSQSRRQPTPPRRERRTPAWLASCAAARPS